MKQLLPQRALSVRQPWAWAIFHGKKVENRSFAAVSHGMTTGEICIHASKGMTREEYENARALILANGVDCPAPADLVRGGIIGTSAVTRIAMPDDEELKDDPWYYGECGLVLAKQVELASPIPCMGALGYFQWEKQPTIGQLQKPLPWMLKWQPPATCSCGERGEVCGLPRGDNNLIHPQHGDCIRCGHKDDCHSFAGATAAGSLQESLL